MPIDWATFGVDLHLDVNPAAGRRSGLERALRQAIRDGRLAPDARLPSTRALAAELDLARGTVSAAYDQLIAEGFLAARTGSGTRVVDSPQPPSRAAAIEEFTAGQPRYDLRPGSPDVTTFPSTAWLRSTRRALNRAPSSVYDYGDPRGQVELRTALAEYLGRARGVIAGPEQIVITSGYVQALALLAGVIVHNGRPGGDRDSGVRDSGVRGSADIAMEDPGLDFHREVVGHAGARVVALPVDDRGARTEMLSTPDFAAVRAAVVTPAHQFPIGITMHPQRRLAITEWARERDGLVIEDDYDDEFRYDRQPVGALQGVAPDHVAYVGTASKTLGPALRLAWVVLPERFIGPFTRAKRYADLHTETVGQLTLADFITSHAYDRHIRAGRVRYRHRRDLMVSRLAPFRGRRLQVHGIAAGLHALIGLPDGGPTEEEVVAHAAARGLAVADLGSLRHSPGEHPQGIIVGYGTPGDATYAAAVDTLARTLRSLTRR